MLFSFAKNLFFSGLSAGKIKRMIAMIMIGPEMGRVKKTVKSPFEIKRDWRSAGSAIGPSTIASTAGARG